MMSVIDVRPWRVKPGTPPKLCSVDPASTPGAPGDKAVTIAARRELQAQLRELQERLFAEATRSVLVVLQGMDASGKDGTIKHVFAGVNAQGVTVTAFSVPTEEERAHDFLWRIHHAAPAAGRIGIFNRSHYEDVLAVRVKNLAPEKVWRPRYRAIVDFERELSESGTRIVKFWLHVSPEEQKRRLQRRLARPDKRWKFNPTDLDDRKLWFDYQDAAEEAITRTSTKDAPWYVVPADNKWYRNWVVTTILVVTLAGMKPDYPDIEIPVEVVIPDVEPRD
jgi:PPK2 family polyphosphate:nucleotide phosphotransferase